MSEEELIEKMTMEFKRRIIEIRAKRGKPDQVTCIVELTLTKKQCEGVSQRIIGRSGLYDYYKAKIDGAVLLSNGAMTTKEDQPDFQLLIDEIAFIAISRK